MIYLYLILGTIAWFGVGALTLVLIQVPMWLSGGHAIKLDLNDMGDVIPICGGPLTTAVMLIIGVMLLICWPCFWGWEKLPVGVRATLSKPITFSLHDLSSITVLRARAKRPRLPGE